MFDFIEEHDLSVGALSVGRVLEGVKVLFQGVDSFGFFVDDLPYNAVCSTADFFNDIVSLEDVGFDLVVGLYHFC